MVKDVCFVLGHFWACIRTWLLMLCLQMISLLPIVWTNLATIPERLFKPNVLIALWNVQTVVKVFSTFSFPNLTYVICVNVCTYYYISLIVQGQKLNTYGNVLLEVYILCTYMYIVHVYKHTYVHTYYVMLCVHMHTYIIHSLICMYVYAHSLCRTI